MVNIMVGLIVCGSFNVFNLHNLIIILTVYGSCNV